MERGYHGVITCVRRACSISAAINSLGSVLRSLEQENEQITAKKAIHITQFSFEALLLIIILDKLPLC